MDLPGYGFAKANESVRQTWSSLVGGYIAQRASLSGLVVVMDARRPFMPTDEWLIEFMKERPNVPMHWLLNKADQLKNMERRRTLDLALRRAAEIGPRVSVQLFSGMKREACPSLPPRSKGARSSHARIVISRFFQKDCLCRPSVLILPCACAACATTTSPVA